MHILLRGTTPQMKIKNMSSVGGECDLHLCVSRKDDWSSTQASRHWGQTVEATVHRQLLLGLALCIGCGILRFSLAGSLPLVRFHLVLWEAAGSFSSSHLLRPVSWVGDPGSSAAGPSLQEDFPSKHWKAEPSISRLDPDEALPGRSLSPGFWKF